MTDDERALTRAGPMNRWTEPPRASDGACPEAHRKGAVDHDG